jgi:hypothetical protein
MFGGFSSVGGICHFLYRLCGFGFGAALLRRVGFTILPLGKFVFGKLGVGWRVLLFPSAPTLVAAALGLGSWPETVPALGGVLSAPSPIFAEVAALFRACDRVFGAVGGDGVATHAAVRDDVGIVVCSCHSVSLSNNYVLCSGVGTVVFVNYHKATAHKSVGVDDSALDKRIYRDFVEIVRVSALSGAKVHVDLNRVLYLLPLFVGRRGHGAPSGEDGNGGGERFGLGGELSASVGVAVFARIHGRGVGVIDGRGNQRNRKNDYLLRGV